MARKIEWAEQALLNLEYIAAFIAKDSPRYAALTVACIIERIEQAAEFPESGRRVPEYVALDLRELFWRDYRIIYRVDAKRVVVVAVVHGRRRLEPPVEP